MLKKYQARKIEQKWQKTWETKKLYFTDLNDSSRPKFYHLVMFPYPSGDKLHVGHWYNFGPADSYARFMRLKGYNVLEPIGFDSFGLPAENYAIKTGTPPPESIAVNCAYMRKQLRAIGTMYDFDKEVVTSSPDYYKWTQWVFLQLYKKGLAYKRNAPVNWCPSCQTVLANEQVQEGVCERCKSEVVQKNLEQWFFRIRDFAEDLLNHEGLDWPEKTVLMQKNWIGKSEGARIVFPCGPKDAAERTQIEVFTTRPDTLCGATYLVIAPEHSLIDTYKNFITNFSQVNRYRELTRKKNDLERTNIEKEKTGVELKGISAINPVTQESISIWVSDYVLSTYGTGAIMAVPAHDERDFEFAKKFRLPIRCVIYPGKDVTERDQILQGKMVYTGSGTLMNSSQFDDIPNEEAKKRIISYLEEQRLGGAAVQYKLRDWLISRQRYWGAPIPIIYCPKCGQVSVTESDLPVLLPTENVDYLPKGKSPLASISSFVDILCPQCGSQAQREVDTMDTFICSSWYFLRYLSSHDLNQAFDKTMVDRWMPVDMYIGGPEHACMHLLYARFIHKVLMDDRTSEPFKRLIHQGLVTKDGSKMSKSRGNVVSPDTFVDHYGSDVFRMYLMFMGPYTEGGDWDDSGINGISRFVERFYNVISGPHNEHDSDTLLRTLHKTIQKLTSDLEKFHFNTAISALMEFTNLALKENGISLKTAMTAAKLISPLAPHLAEELWHKLGGPFSIFHQSWPTYDAAWITDEEIELVVQINGKVRGKVKVGANISESEALLAAKAIENVKKYLEGQEILKEIYVQGKLVSFVV